MTPPNDVVIVGASLAGLRVVQALRQRGYGGRITWIGAEALRPYDRPPLSKQILRGEWDPERASLKAAYDTLQVDLRLGKRAVSLDASARRIALDDDTTVTYDRLIIATGAAARTLPGSERFTGVHTLRTLGDATAIRHALAAKPNVAVVGAGFIGLEVAASCRALGLDVTIVEAAPVPLGAVLGDVMGTEIADLHRAHGVTLRTGVGVSGFVGERAVAGLRLSDDTVIHAELVVVGIGVVPETRWLEGSGVLLDGGVVCDERCRTSLPDVFACGDVCSFHNSLFDERMRVEHWTNAVEQANAVAATLIDEAAPVLSSVPYFWSDQYDAKIQFAGRIAPGDTLRVEEGTVRDKNLVALYGRAGKLRGVLTVNKPAALIRYRRAITEGAEF